MLIARDGTTVGALSGGCLEAEVALRARAVIDTRTPIFFLHATAAPGEPGTLYVVEQAGRIVVLEAGHIRSAPFLDIRRLISSGAPLCGR